VWHSRRNRQLASGTYPCKGLRRLHVKASERCRAVLMHEGHIRIARNPLRVDRPPSNNYVPGKQLAATAGTLSGSTAIALFLRPCIHDVPSDG
jgi:hypothetical protein